MIRVLLLGAAFSADLHMDGYDRYREEARIVAICDRNPERVRSLAERYRLTDYRAFDDIKTAIQETDCDLVDICLPNFLHKDAALLALNAGRPIICEKPLATTVEDAQAIVDLAAAKNLHVYYAEDWLYAPAVRRALEIVEQGALGKIIYMRARECHNGSHSPFAQTIRYCGGGSLIHLGIHPIALALAMRANDWREVVAMTSGGLEKNSVHKTMEGEDWGAAMIRFGDGSAALIEANYVTQGGMEDYIDFYGTEGCLHVDLNFSGPIRCFSVPGIDYVIEKVDITNGWTRPAVDEKYNLGYVGEIGHFIRCAAAGQPAQPGLRGEDGLEALKVVEAIYTSAREGRAVSRAVTAD